LGIRRRTPRPQKNATLWKSEHRGETYYFCSQSCKMEFDDNPYAYARRQEQAMPRDPVCGMEVDEQDAAEIKERTGQREPSPGRERR
jgi:YHS domain-containing protein